MSVLWSLKFHLPLRHIPIKILTISPLTQICQSQKIANMLLVLAFTHNWTNLDFISISLPLLHNPLMEFTTWLDWISSGPTWTLSLNNLFDPHMIYENLLYHRSNDLDFFVACLVPMSLRGYNWTSELETIVVSNCSTTTTLEAEDNCNPLTKTFKFHNIYTLRTRSAWNFIWASRRLL